MGLPLKELLGGDLPPISRTTVAIAAAGFIGAVLVRQFFRILRRLAGERWQAWALRREPGSCCTCCRALALLTMSAADRRRFERGQRPLLGDDESDDDDAERGGGGSGRSDALQAEVAELRREVGESREMLGAIAGKLDELRRTSDERVLNAFLVGASRATPEDSEDSKAAQRALAQFY